MWISQIWGLVFAGDGNATLWIVAHVWLCVCACACGGFEGWQSQYRRFIHIPSERATVEQLLLTHTAAHIETVQRNSEQIREHAGADLQGYVVEKDGKDTFNKYGIFEADRWKDTYYNQHSATAAELAAGGLIALMQQVVEGRVKNGKLGWQLVCES